MPDYGELRFEMDLERTPGLVVEVKLPEGFFRDHPGHELKSGSEEKSVCFL